MPNLIGTDPNQVPVNGMLGRAAFQDVISVNNGGTGLSTFTNTGIVYASSTSTLATSSALTFNGTNVGIGASTPTNTLDINTASATFRIRNATGGNDFVIKNIAGPVSIAGSVANTSIAFMTNDTERMRIEGTTGNVGIGILTPAAKLDVAGTTQISANTTSSALTITQTGTGNALLVEDSASPDATPFVIDSNGRAIIGSTAAAIYSSALTIIPVLQVNAAGAATSGISRFSANTAANSFWFLKSRGATVGAFDAVVSGDTLGTIGWLGADGVDGIQAATIAAFVDGTPGTNDMPGRLVFSTTLDGASTPTERMRLDASGNLGIGMAANSGVRLEVAGNQSNWRRFSTDATPFYHAIIKSRGAVGATTTVALGDNIGSYQFYAYNGTNEQQAAAITAKVASTGTVSATSMPGQLDFYTTPNGSNTGILRLSIDSAGNVNIPVLTASKPVFTDASDNLTSIGTVGVDSGGTGVQTLTGIVKGNGASAFTAAVAGTDYVAPGTATTFTVAQSFPDSGVLLKGSSTGYTTLTSANASATAYTVTIPAETMTVGYKNIPPVGTKAVSYTLAPADVGKYVQLTTGGSITIPDAIFAEGDVVSVFNNTAAAITITCTITTAYIAGTDADKATVSLATRGTATILFISGTVCVISGNVV